jgi:hypothetical protein
MMDLVEKVAMEIHDKVIAVVGDAREPEEICRDAARAALRIALEAAAKVAKVQWLKSDHGTLGDADYGCALCEEAAKATRSLLPEETTR